MLDRRSFSVGRWSWGVLELGLGEAGKEMDGWMDRWMGRVFAWDRRERGVRFERKAGGGREVEEV